MSAESLENIEGYKTLCIAWERKESKFKEGWNGKCKTVANKKHINQCWNKCKVFNCPIKISSNCATNPNPLICCPQ